MRSEILLGMVEQIQAKKINLYSLLTARNGAIVYEAFINPCQSEAPASLIKM
jgi:hypothetical protein